MNEKRLASFPMPRISHLTNLMTNHVTVFACWEDTDGALRFRDGLKHHPEDELIALAQQFREEDDTPEHPWPRKKPRD